MTFCKVTIWGWYDFKSISQKIYANFHKPTWETSKRRLFTAKIAKKIFRELGNIAGNDKKKSDSKQERVVG